MESPPTRVISTRGPHGVSLSLPPPSSAPLGILLRLLLYFSDRMALSLPAVGSAGVCVCVCVVCCPLLPLSPFSASPLHLFCPSFLFRRSPNPVGLLGLLNKSRGLATMWASLRRLENYPGHDDPGLLFGRPSPPPNEEGKPSSLPAPPLFLYPPPPPLLRLAMGGVLLKSWGFPPIYCIRPRTKGVCACSGGALPSPSRKPQEL